MSTRALELAEEIRQTGRRSPQELVPLIDQAEKLAHDADDPFTRGVSVRAAGSAHQMLNNFSAALDRYESAVRYFSEAGDSAQVGRTLLAKVGPLAYLGKLKELFECAKDARELFQTHGDDASLARLNVNLGNAYFRMDRFHEALGCYEDAFPTLEELKDNEAYLAASLNAGVVLTTLHRFDDADHRYDRAEAVAAELGMRTIEQQCQYNRTYLDYLRGNSGAALKEIQRLRPGFEQSADDQHLCQCWLDEAEILLEIGDLPEAAQSARTARDLAQKLTLNYELGKSLVFEAIARLREGDDQAAHTMLRDAIRRFEAEGNNVWTAVSQLQAALFPDAEGVQQALRHATAARQTLNERSLLHRVAFADIVIGRLQRSTGELQLAIDSFRRAAEVSEQCGSGWMQFHACHELGACLSAQGDDEGLVYLRKAEALLDSLWNRIGSDDLKMAFLTDRENVYTHLVSDVADDDSHEAFRLSDKSRSRVLIEQLARQGEHGAREEISSRLGADETIVEYFISGDDLYIFVATQNGIECVHRRDVIPRIEHEWAHLERHLTACSVTWERLKRVSGHLERTALTHLKQLYDHLLSPVREYLNPNMVIVPHGFLHGIPFQALHDGEAYLSDHRTVVYSPSAALYTVPSGEPADERPLFVGFSLKAEEGIIEEVERAAGQFDDSQLLINPSAGELADQLSRRRPLLHIAGHAGVDPVQGSLSWLETPEGRLTSKDLIEMKFQSDTIVVTGCHTARRVISAGDEWLGLMRAFYLSGAHTIVSAHWAIRDESARIFSSTFYQHYNKQDAGAAVQAATARIREEFPHPYFWGGFGTFVRKRGGDS